MFIVADLVSLTLPTQGTYCQRGKHLCTIQGRILLNLILVQKAGDKYNN